MPKEKVTHIRFTNDDYDELMKVAKSMNKDISKLIRFSVEPYIIRQKIINSIENVEKKSFNYKNFGFSDLINARRLFEYYQDELQKLSMDLFEKIESINNVERMMMEKISSKQLNIRFTKEKKSKKVKV